MKKRKKKKKIASQSATAHPQKRKKRDASEVERQLRIGRKIMEEYRETFQTLAKM